MEFDMEAISKIFKIPNIDMDNLNIETYTKFDFLLDPNGELYEDFGYDIAKVDNVNLPTRFMVDDAAFWDNPPYHTPIIIVNGTKGITGKTWRFDDLIPITISREPKTLLPDELFQARTNMSPEEWEEIYEFVIRNYDLLLAHWYGTLERDFGTELVNKLWRIKKPDGTIAIGTRFWRNCYEQCPEKMD